MGNSTQLYCIKLISNSGLKLQDNQLVALCDINRSLPLEFLVRVRADKFSKIWFYLEHISSNIVKVHLVAYCYDDTNILDGMNNESINAKKLTQLSHSEIIEIPKKSVNADSAELQKIKFYESLYELRSVKRNLYSIEDLCVKPSVNWKKVVCIEIRKYNAKYLEVISKKLGIETGYLPHLKDLNASKVYWDMSRPYFMAFLVREESVIDFTTNSYKGIILWNSVYTFLTKKDKDRLLKMEGIDIKKLISERFPKSINEINSQDSKTSDINQELNVDKILDKISKYGMDSLTPEEKKFLDDESKKED